MSEELINKAYEAVELAKATGKIRKGINEVTKAIEKTTAKLVAVAGDVNPKEIVMHIGPLCKEKNIPFVQVKTKEELGTSAGLEVGTSAVAVVKEGDAKKVIKEISDEISKE